MPDEIWKPIAGTDYEASSEGRIRKVLVMKLTPTQFGYLKVQLHKRGQQARTRRTWFVHRLIAQAFLGECPDGLMVNHKDGCKTNNHLENLEYVTRAENAAHASQTGLYLTGESHPAAKLSNEEARELRRLWETGKYTARQLAKKFGISPANAHKVAKGKHHVAMRN